MKGDNSNYTIQGGVFNSLKFSKSLVLFELLSSVITRIRLRNFKINFKIKPVHQKFKLAGHGPRIAIFAESQLSHGGAVYTAKRIIDKNPDHTGGTGVHLISYKKQKFEHNFFVGGEDPRLFIKNNQPFLYFQKPNSQLIDCKIKIYSILEKKIYTCRTTNKFNGKNWIPLDLKSRKMSFIYSIQPKIIIQEISRKNGRLDFDTKNIETFPKLEWGDAHESSIGGIRGGTPLVPIGKNLHAGFTHITPKGYLKDFHCLGFLLFDDKSLQMTHLQLSSVKSRLLIDPYGIRWDGEHFFVNCSLATGNPYYRDVVGYEVEMAFESENLIRQTFAQGEKIE